VYPINLSCIWANILSVRSLLSTICSGREVFVYLSLRRSLFRDLCSEGEALRFSVHFWAHLIHTLVVGCMVFISSCAAIIVNIWLGMWKAFGLFQGIYMLYQPPPPPGIYYV
jgi:hypothetical protein